MLVFRNAAKVLLALVLVAFATQAVRADMFNHGEYGDLGIMQGGIRDADSYDDGQVNLYKLFNEFFGLTGAEAYGSSNDLFYGTDLLKGRGVLEEYWIALPDAQLYGVNKVAALGHNLNFKSDTDDPLGTINLPATIVDGQYIGNNPLEFNTQNTGSVNLSDGTIFSMSLETFWGPDHVGDVAFKSAGYASWDPQSDYDYLIHMIAFDVTDLMKVILGNDNVTSAYMFCWEDLMLHRPSGGGDPADWDFQDFVYILVNVDYLDGPYVSGDPDPTPEPATMVVLLMGLAACPLAQKLRRRRSE